MGVALVDVTHSAQLGRYNKPRSAGATTSGSMSPQWVFIFIVTSILEFFLSRNWPFALLLENVSALSWRTPLLFIQIRPDRLPFWTESFNIIIIIINNNHEIDYWVSTFRNLFAWVFVARFFYYVSCLWLSPANFDLRFFGRHFTFRARYLKFSICTA